MFESTKQVVAKKAGGWSAGPAAYFLTAAHSATIKKLSSQFVCLPKLHKQAGAVG